MNSAAATASAPATPAFAAPPPAAPASDAATIDFSALLNAAPAAATTATAAAAAATATAVSDTGAPVTAADARSDTAATGAASASASAGVAPAGKADDDRTPDDAVLENAGLPGLLLALRQSLACLLGASAAPGSAAADTRSRSKTAPTPITPGAVTTKQAPLSEPVDAALADLTSASGDSGGDAADPAMATGDQRFDAMLAAMADHTAQPATATASAGVLSALGLNSAAAAGTTTPAAVLSAPPMTVPPDHPQFVGDLGERIVWIADASLGTGISSAKIELHPLDLGGLSVHVQMRGDVAQVAFAADNPATRAMLQDSLPQLRELMSVQGLQLLRAQVEQRVGATRASDSTFSQSRGRGEGRDAPATAVRRVTKLELVDAYA